MRLSKKAALVTTGTVFAALAVGLWFFGPRLWTLAQESAMTAAIRAQIQELEAAKTRWAAHPFSRYRLVRKDSSAIQSCQLDVEIRDEKTITVFQSTCGSSTGTVTDIFNEIESTITRRKCGPRPDC
jgi:hypothetical protein